MTWRLEAGHMWRSVYLVRSIDNEYRAQEKGAEFLSKLQWGVTKREGSPFVIFENPELPREKLCANNNHIISVD